ncbi:ArsR/SmtB family transcription factor [Achromobacter xylosoxidans]|uniref:ArsR/SmtB family transcription factor n=1 Tax=Alcaligenes xylosoxydans xylosoxydans TaxID=85698 RepID=UPI001F145414|nr:metalloregulator ArsR/SmtB family transcription factor [Achromobacter xylosoxidans]
MPLGSKHDRETVTQCANALGHLHRLTLLDLLKEGARSVAELAEHLNLSVWMTEKHLQILRRASLVEAERKGKQVFYWLADVAEYIALLSALRAAGERNADAIRVLRRDFLRADEQLEAVSYMELLRRLKDGTVTLHYVSSQDEDSIEHTSDVWEVPVAMLERCAGTLGSGQDVVAYCRGPHCILSFAATTAVLVQRASVRMLRRSCFDH